MLEKQMALSEKWSPRGPGEPGLQGEGKVATCPRQTVSQDVPKGPGLGVLRDQLQPWRWTSGEDPPQNLDFGISSSRAGKQSTFVVSDPQALSFVTLLWWLWCGSHNAVPSLAHGDSPQGWQSGGCQAPQGSWREVMGAPFIPEELRLTHTQPLTSWFTSLLMLWADCLGLFFGLGGWGLVFFFFLAFDIFHVLEGFLFCFVLNSKSNACLLKKF